MAIERTNNGSASHLEWVGLNGKWIFEFFEVSKMNRVLNDGAQMYFFPQRSTLYGSLPQEIGLKTHKKSFTLISFLVRKHTDVQLL